MRTDDGNRFAVSIKEILSFCVSNIRIFMVPSANSSQNLHKRPTKGIEGRAEKGVEQGYERLNRLEGGEDSSTAMDQEENV